MFNYRQILYRFLKNENIYFSFRKNNSRPTRQLPTVVFNEYDDIIKDKWRQFFLPQFFIFLQNKKYKFLKRDLNVAYNTHYLSKYLRSIGMRQTEIDELFRC